MLKILIDPIIDKFDINLKFKAQKIFIKFILQNIYDYVFFKSGLIK